MDWKLGALILIGLSGCGQSYEAQTSRLEKFVSLHKIGSSQDYYLVKAGASGYENVALVYGFADDFEFCLEVADLYMQKYPGDRYTCAHAN